MSDHDPPRGRPRWGLRRSPKAYVAYHDPEISNRMRLPKGIDDCLDREDPQATGRALAAAGYVVDWRFVVWNDLENRPNGKLVPAPPAGTIVYSVLAVTVSGIIDEATRHLRISITPRGRNPGMGSFAPKGNLGSAEATVPPPQGRDPDGE